MKTSSLILLLSALTASAFSPSLPTSQRTQIHTTTSSQFLFNKLRERFQGQAVETVEEEQVEEGAVVTEATEFQGMDPQLTTLDDQSAVEEEKSETQKLMDQVKDAGLAGVISYAAWELAFWFISVPVCLVGYREVTGHWPDFSNQEDMQYLGAEAFAFVNFARFAVPLRIGLALGTTPWIQENIVDRFLKKDDDDKESNVEPSVEEE